MVTKQCHCHSNRQFTQKTSFLAPISSQAYTMVHQALCHMLVLPWPEMLDCNQQWEGRSSELGRVVTGATQIFQQLQQTPSWSQNTSLLEGGWLEALGTLDDSNVTLHEYSHTHTHTHTHTLTIHTHAHTHTHTHILTHTHTHTL